MNVITIQKSKGMGGLLPALGIQLADGRLSAKAEVLPLPMLKAAGIEVPKSKGENWAPFLNKANFNIDPKKSNTLKVIVFHNRKIRGAMTVYKKIRTLVNSYNATYRFEDEPTQLISAGEKTFCRLHYFDHSHSSKLSSQFFFKCASNFRSQETRRSTGGL